jgi:hypothetical protein
VCSAFTGDLSDRICQLLLWQIWGGVDDRDVMGRATGGDGVGNVVAGMGWGCSCDRDGAGDVAVTGMERGM